MDLVNPLAQQYSERYTSPEDRLLKEVADFTYGHHPKSHMLSGHLQGRLLEMISHMISPRRILEIGTFTGYSALCLAKGLEEDGMLHTLEVREDDAAVANGYFQRSENHKKITLHIGDAAEIIGQLDETWDLVFIDADKEQYINYFNLVFSRLRAKGFILADNVLFHGQVLQEKISGKNARAIQEFNDYVLQRTDVEKLMLPVRDGLYVIRKLHD
ncbi:MAG TPA: O-methyltransferase [Flavisolibacter sp.]